MKRINPFLLCSLVLAILVAAPGCSTITSLFETDKPVESTQSHLQDVKVPGELKIDRDNSFVFEAQGFKAGTLFFTGYVDADSVMEFFKTTMPTDGWRLKSIFRHPRSMLLFDKPDKSCVVVIYEKTILTHVEVWVAPLL